MDDDQIKLRAQQNKDEVILLLESTGRKGIDSLVRWLCDETDFFSAPAAARLEFHGCHLGGLAQHSLNVLQAFNSIALLHEMAYGKKDIAELLSEDWALEAHALPYTIGAKTDEMLLEAMRKNDHVGALAFMYELLTLWRTRKKRQGNRRTFPALWRRWSLARCRSASTRG